MSETKQHPQPGSPSTRRIDRRKTAVRYRYTCPQGHVNWDRTNNHIWCPSCRRQNEHGNDVDPEYWFIIDQKTDEQIAWENVELVEDGS